MKYERRYYCPNCRKESWLGPEVTAPCCFRSGCGGAVLKLENKWSCREKINGAVVAGSILLVGSGDAVVGELFGTHIIREQLQEYIQNNLLPGKQMPDDEHLTAMVDAVCENLVNEIVDDELIQRHVSELASEAVTRYLERME